jgi:lipopolysaccharide/colanic/teichoic acid biosynthesis glycosyltransferase
MNTMHNSALDARVIAHGRDVPSEELEGVLFDFASDDPMAIGPQAAAHPLTDGGRTGTDAARFVALPPHRGARFVRQFELPLLLVGGLGPAIMLWGLFGHALFSGAFLETMVALAGSITISWYILSRLKDHANARHLSYVLPVNVGALLSALAVMALLRIPYSASLFASGAVAAVSVSFLAAAYARRLVRPHLVVSGGRSSEIQLGGQFLPAPSFADLEQVIASGRRDWAIVADLHYPHSESGERLFAKAALAGVPVYHFRQVAEMQSGQVKIAHLSENELGSLIPDASYTSLKRLIDVAAVLVLIPVCLPLFAVLALLIRLDSPGNPIFIQERMGFRGQTFRMIKFRTMRQREVIAEAGAIREDAMTKSDDDRITKIGRFLRKTRIDELPQIFNVLRGEMSLIGPRPEACSLSMWYEGELPFYSYRHVVRPGITGWAQVNQGHVTDVTEVLGKLRYDFYYIKNISLWLDLLIALKTLRVIFGGIGAK